MGYTEQHEWHEHYASGKNFRPLGADERALLARLLPARPGARALEVACGTGELALHLADHGYAVDAVDYAASAIERATAQADDGAASVQFALMDIENDPLDLLPHLHYDLVIMRQAYAFLTDRAGTMDALVSLLAVDGTLCVITPHAERVPAAQRDIALDEAEINILSARWKEVVREECGPLTVLVLRDPVRNQVTYADRARPAPNAVTGAGVVVLDENGRLLLGHSVRGLLELPGGKNEAGEDLLAAAVRELKEETGLIADLSQARLLALLMGSTHGIPWMTAAALVPRHTGVPEVREPHLIRRWQWYDPAELPRLGRSVFTPSAHVIDTVWPGLLPHLPPVHRHLFKASPRQENTERQREGQALRHALVDRLQQQGHLRTPPVIQAFARVPRHRFAPAAPLEEAYGDDKAPITRRDGEGRPTSSVSAAWLQARMIEKAQLGPGSRVLEVGSGGCNAAYLAEIVGRHGQVVSVDIDPVVCESARRLLADTGYPDVEVRLGDGRSSALCAGAGRDAVLVTVEARDIAPAWTAALAEQGRLVVPLTLHGYTWALTLEKRGELLVGDGDWTVCGFVPMQGPMPEVPQIALHAGLIRLRREDGPLPEHDLRALDAALNLPRHEHRTGVTIGGMVPFDQLMLHLACTLDNFVRLQVDPGADHPQVEPPKGWNRAAVVHHDSFAYVVTEKTEQTAADGTGVWEFIVHAFGPHARQAAARMTEAVRTWDRDLRNHPGPRLTALPAGTPDEELPPGAVIDKPHCRVVVDWSPATSAADKAPGHKESPA
ncbi:methyltransferase, FxLD system [Streptomyces sp. NPDC050095]|uniref:methyltransferase, FxLD system n=1 Tax=unclassified Streptomyces TaxID=2593676 RepID=UPI003422B745